MLHEELEIFGTGQVRSVQSLEFQQALFPTTREAAEEAGFFYFDYLNRLYPPFVRVRYRDDGGIEIRFLSLRLLTFAPPRVVTRPELAAIRYRIRSGLLVQRQQQGTGELRIEIWRRRLVLAVEGYYSALIGPNCSEWRQAIYLKTQAAIHRRVAERFLDELACRLVVRSR